MSQISCDSNENTIVKSGLDLKLSTSLEAMEFINVRFAVQDGSTLTVELPNLQWQSTETEEVSYSRRIMYFVEYIIIGISQPSHATEHRALGAHR